MVKSTFAKYAERVSILVVALIVVAWVVLTFFVDDSQEPDSIDQGQSDQVDDSVESVSGNETAPDQSSDPGDVPPADGDAASGGDDPAEPSDGAGDGAPGEAGTDGGLPLDGGDSAEDPGGSESDSTQPGQEVGTESAGDGSDDGEGISAEPDQFATSGSEDIAPEDAGTDGDMPSDGSDSAEISDGLESERIEDAQSGPKAEAESSGGGSDDGEGVGAEPDQSASSGSEDIAPEDAGTDGDMPSDGSASAEISDGLESERIEDAQPSPKAETESSGDGSDDGEGVGAEPDQSASSGSEDIAPDDAGTDGGMPPDGGDPAGISDGLESERVEDAQPGPKAETESSGDGLDGGEGVSTEPDQSRVGTEDGVSDDDGTEGSAALDDGASAEISDGLESERVEDAQPGPKAETVSSGDGSDGGEGVSAEPDQSAPSGSEGIAPDDAGTDGGMLPAGSASAEISDGLESERVEDAQPGPKAEAVSSGDGLDGGEGVSTEPDQSRVGSEDGVSDDDVTEGSASLDDGASAVDSDGPKADSANGEPLPVASTEPLDGIDTPVQEETAILPTFDVVRVDQFKFATIAGRGMPNWAIDVLINSELKESGTISGDGQFAFVFQLDTERGPSEITLVSRDGDGTIYRSPDTVLILAPEDVEAPESEEIQLASADPLLPAVLIATPESVKLKQAPIPDRPAGNPGENLRIDSISYDMAGEVVLAGRGGANGFIKIYLDNLPVKTEQITDFGTWEISLHGVDAGRYMLKLEELDQSENVVASVVTPFQKEFQGDALEIMKEAAQALGKSDVLDMDDGRIADVVTVQPGYTLWGISRRSFGQGRFYVRIYHTNIDQIDDPDLIFPGQLLVVPNLDTTPPRRPSLN